MDDLFEQNNINSLPLAARMRPKNLDEFIGQDHILGKGRLLRRAILADQLTSVIFAGPPGCGKTTLAHVIAQTTKSAFFSLNAVLAGLADLRDIIQKAQDQKKLYARKTILFVDEVHRWNKAQQDALLPWTENGTIILVGATTENPYFKVNRALVSRSHIFQLVALTETDLRKAVSWALHDTERGYGRYHIDITEEALAHLIQFAAGDCRALLNALELAVETTPKHFPPAPGESIVIDLSIAEDSIQRKAMPYDPTGDDHYDTISAFIKSVRGSDPDAALYWLAQMLHRGEDPDFIWRRLLILASEDIGLAAPDALSVVTSCLASFERIGLPEGYFPLSHATLYLATCPKSNSTMGFFDALKEVEAASRGTVPIHLRDANRDAAGFGHGQGYKYPHTYDEHWVAQQYLPVALRGKIFYQPSEEGAEKLIKQRVLERREVQLAQCHPEEQAENYIATSIQEEQSWQAWTRRTSLEATQAMAKLRTQLFDSLALPSHSCVCFYGETSGYLVLEALRRYKNGGVYVLLPNEKDEQALLFLTKELPELHRPHIHIASGYTRIPDAPATYEAIVLYRPTEDPALLMPLVQEQLGPHSALALVLPAQTASLADIFEACLTPAEKQVLKQAEAQLNQSLYDTTKWKQILQQYHWDVHELVITAQEPMRLPSGQISKWLAPKAPLGGMLAELAPVDAVHALKAKLVTQTGPVMWTRHYRLWTGQRDVASI